MLKFSETFRTQIHNLCCQGSIGIEMHGLMSAAKPFSSWIAQQAIQECREACGGHGYLKGNRLSYFSIFFD
jgi:alkylation response protein AidB-like acyl-CoA dehydrogenase